MYGEKCAKTIINNCDSCLYLGGQDVDTARYMSIKANKTADSILNMPVGDAWLFVRGQKPQQVTKFNVEQYDLFNPAKAERKEKRPKGFFFEELPLEGLDEPRKEKE